MKAQRTIRGLGMASCIALTAVLLALPVAADDGSSAPEGPAEPASFALSAFQGSGRLVDWGQLLMEADDVHWTVALPDTEGADLATDEGVTPSGVEWTRVTATHPSGVEWTRLRASDVDGSSWIKTSTTGRTGVEWTFLTFERADGETWVESQFLDADGRVWSRRAPGRGLDGVEWT
jgi:hypothetical protein